MYTDPGSGIFFLQVLAAASLTAIYRFRRALASIFRKTQSSNTESGE
ncbi:MAG: hypothetical protein HY821_13250 [Acidobacteria bacterium]|nr:hypothetical protein [Acidobacteriota bacterium]